MQGPRAPGAMWLQCPGSRLEGTLGGRWHAHASTGHSGRRTVSEMGHKEDFDKVTKAVSGRISSFQQIEPQRPVGGVQRAGLGCPPSPPTVVSRPQSCACHRARTVHLLREHPGGNLCDPGLGRDLLRNNPQKTVQEKKKNELDLTKTFKTVLFKKILLREAKDKPQTGESLIKYSYLSMQITLTPQQQEENPR